MKRTIVTIALIFAFTASVFSQTDEYRRITEKVNALIKNSEIEASTEEITFFSGAVMKKQILSRIKSYKKEKAPPFDKKSMTAIADYVELDNYALRNVFALENEIFFLNYEVRIDWSNKKTPKSAEDLFPAKFSYYLLLTYNIREKKIQNFIPEINAYSPLNFHKKVYGNRTVLYCIRNTSSLGAATEKIMLAVFDAMTFKPLVSEVVLYSQSVLGPIVFQKDFEFTEVGLHVWGRDFDFENSVYINGYDSVYTF